MLLERVQVVSKAPSEHHGLLIEEDGINDPACNTVSEDLWYDGDPCSEVLEAQLESINPINDNPAGWLGQSEEGCHNTGLASTWKNYS